MIHKVQFHRNSHLRPYTYVINEPFLAQVERDAEQRAYGYRAQAENFESEAQLSEMKGEQAKTAGYLGAAGSLLSSASSLGGKWNGFNFGGTPATEAEELASGVRAL